MGKRLSSFVEDVVNAQTLEEEGRIVQDEMAELRTIAKRNSDEALMPRMVAKILYLDTIGCDVSFGEMQVVVLMSSDRLGPKRIGYITAAHLIDASNERMVLMTATVQKDLLSKSPVSQRLALQLIANNCSAEMAYQLAPEVLRLCASNQPALVQKAAGMAAVAILRLGAEGTDFRSVVAPMLNHGYHSVVSVGTHLAIAMLRRDPTLRGGWSQFSAPFARIVKGLFSTRGKDEFAFGIFNDPFLQIRVLQVLAALGVGGDEMDEILGEVVTSVDVQRNTGRSILLQAVETVRAIGRANLRGLAFNAIGRLFGGAQANLVYSALSAFSRILYTDGVLVDRSGADSLVLQRYRSQVVQCLEHSDPSIRRRALDVVTALVDASNVRDLVPEIISYLRISEPEFRAEMANKVFEVIQRFAPDLPWRFDAVLSLFAQAGDFIGPPLLTKFCCMLSQQTGVLRHAIPKLGDALKGSFDSSRLVSVAAWGVGEFQDCDDGIVDVLTRLLNVPQLSNDAKCFVIMALAKLGVRFSLGPEVSRSLSALCSHEDAELSQRAEELMRIMTLPTARALLEPMGKSGCVVPDGGRPTEGEKVPGNATSVSEPTPSRAPAAEVVAQPVVEPKVKYAPPAGAIEALRTREFVLFVELGRNQQVSTQLAIRASFFGLSSVPLHMFRVAFGVPQGWVVSSQPVQPCTLELEGRPHVVLLILENRGPNPLQMAVVANYLYGTQPVTERLAVKSVWGPTDS